MAGEIEDDEVDELDDEYEVPPSEDYKEESDDETDEFDDDADEGEIDMDEELDASPKERAARALEIRRALEVRDEQRRLSEDLDYLDFDDE